MGIFSRFSDIVNSNLNSLLDKAEDPEKMVRLIIQEMEDTLVEVRSNSAKVLAERKELSRRIDKLQAGADEWQNKAEFALTKEREDLARGALLEKQRVAALVENLKAELEQHDSTLEKLKGEIQQLQDKLKDAKSRQQSILMRQQTATSRLEVKKTLDSNRIDDAIQKFEQYERKIDNIEAQVESYDLGKKKTLNNEFAELEAEESISSELEALKSKIKADK